MGIRLNVPYQEKEEAKLRGAKFDWRGKFWYYPGEKLPDELRRWYREENGTIGMNRENKKSVNDMLGEAESDTIHLLTDGQGIGGIHLERYKTVTELNQMISDTFLSTPQFMHIYVQGEVTNYRGTNGGHYYFSLKDEKSLIDCFMWGADARGGLNFELRAGQQVAISGIMNYYVPNGRAKLQAMRIFNIGDGAANLALIKLREQLRAEGLFDEDRKKPIPEHPTKVGVITSKSGMAIGDIRKNWKLRDPYVELCLYHVNVQGKNAVPTMLAGLDYMDKQGYDTLIIGRGGGTDEELNVYNDETIARKVASMNTPIISAVGHEGHWTLIDLAADYRSITPTHAAEKAFPNVMKDIHNLEHLMREMYRNMDNHIQRTWMQLNTGKAYLEKNSPGKRLEEQKSRLEQSRVKMSQRMEQIIVDRQHRFEKLVTRLHGLSPTAKLVNGFGHILVNDRPLTTVEDVAVGDNLKVTIHDGEIITNVTKIKVMKNRKLQN